MEIFQPGLKFLREERERQRMNVAHPTDGADPLMKIDLDAGTATIVIPAPRSDQPSDGLSDQPADRLPDQLSDPSSEEGPQTLPPGSGEPGDEGDEFRGD